MFFTGTAMLATSTFGKADSWVIGARSRCGSNDSFACMFGLIVIDEDTTSVV